jgi:hypothetical protein
MLPVAGCPLPAASSGNRQPATGNARHQLFTISDLSTAAAPMQLFAVLDENLPAFGPNMMNPHKIQAQVLSSHEFKR